MKAVYLEKPWEVGIKEIEQRPLEKGEALIEIVSAGICGSDIGAFRGKNNLVSYPRIIGHELAGIVKEIPADNPKGLKVGDKVVVDPYLYCGHCYPCSIGRTNCCNELHVLGVHVDGGMTKTFAHPADMLVKIPDDMDWVLAAMAEPLTISLHGLHRLQLTKGEHVAIFGAGPIGMYAALAALHYEAVPIMIDPVDERLDFAKECGVQHIVNPTKCDQIEEVKKITNGRMCECVMEASGANAAVRATLDLVCHAGRIALTGWPKTETSLPTDMITRKEIDIRGARTSAGEFEESVDLIYNKKVDVQKLLTKTISIDEAPDTIIDIEKNPGDYMKVVVMM